MMAGQRLSSQA